MFKRLSAIYFADLAAHSAQAPVETVGFHGFSWFLRALNS